MGKKTFFGRGRRLFIGAAAGAVLVLSGCAREQGYTVVDGTMRVTESRGITPELGASGNWEGAELRFTASLALDGKLLSHGIIVEGSFRITGMENRSIELETEYFKVDGVEYSLLDAVYSF